MAQRVKMSGPRVDLPAEITTPLGLILHELATNASKYGSLGKAGGGVDLQWELSELDGSGGQLTLTWREHGGPPVNEPESHGFGSFLVENGIVGARVDREFHTTGLICTIKLPLAQNG
jgi:two-component system CheB/CheR fusion protein